VVRTKRYDKLITIRISEELYNKITSLAIQTNKKPSTLLRIILENVVKGITKVREQEDFYIIHLDYPLIFIEKK